MSKQLITNTYRLNHISEYLKRKFVQPAVLLAVVLLAVSPEVFGQLKKSDEK